MKTINESLVTEIQEHLLSSDFVMFEQARNHSILGRRFSIAFEVDIPPSDEGNIRSVIINDVANKIRETVLFKEFKKDQEEECEDLKSSFEKEIAQLKFEIESLTAYRNVYNMNYKMKHGEELNENTSTN